MRRTPEVRRRYATDREDLDGVVLPFSDKPRVESTTCAVGRSWFNRQTARGVGSYTRYDHGGISLVEAKGADGTFAPVQGGTRQLPITVTPRHDKVEFGSALDVFDDLNDMG